MVGVNVEQAREKERKKERKKKRAGRACLLSKLEVVPDDGA
jgi:hypothetical protein